MPAQYAHYRFGNQVLPRFPSDLHQMVQRQRNLYDLGLQGPDPLFYHSYVSRTRICDLGYRLHSETGRDFFTRCCEHLRRDPSEESQVYLYGLLGHFCLDSLCHPFVDAQEEVSHYELETEFDRSLLAEDGYDLRRCGNPVPIALSRCHARTIAGLYPEISARDLRNSVASMALAQKLLSTPAPAGRRIVARVLRNSHYRDMQLTERENRRCSHLNAPLRQLFDRAVANYPVCLEQLNECLHHGTTLGPLFSTKFG